MDEKRRVPANSLEAISGHKNYYRSGSGLIYFKRGKLKFSCHTTSILAAKKYVETVLLQKREGLTKIQAKRRVAGVQSPLIRDVWQNEVMDDRKGNMASTRATYDRNWKIGIEPFWGNRSVSEITEENISQYRSWYLDEFAESGRFSEKTYVHFKMLVQLCAERGYIRRIPLNLSQLERIDDILRRDRQYQKAGRTAAEKEIAAILAAGLEIAQNTHGGTTSEHYQLLGARGILMVTLGARAGLRKMEALTLQWERVDFRGRKFQVWSKSKAWRFVPMNDEIEAAFREQRRWTGESRWVFPMPTDPDRHLSAQMGDKVWHQMKERAQIATRLRFHDLRHTFATFTAEKNWPPALACRVLDMSLSIYQSVYCKPSFESIYELMNRKTDSSKGGGQ